MLQHSRFRAEVVRKPLVSCTVIVWVPVLASKAIDPLVPR